MAEKSSRESSRNCPKTGAALTHIDAKGEARMVDVSAKPATERTATPSDRPPANAELVAPPAMLKFGLDGAAIHVAVARSGPLERNALTIWLPFESFADDIVKNHHTPAFGA